MGAHWEDALVLLYLKPSDYEVVDSLHMRCK